MNVSSQAGLLLTLTELVGDVSLKQYAKTDNTMFLGVGTASYLGLVYLLQYYLRIANLAIVNGYWDAFSNILTAIVAMWMGEAISNTQLAGLFIISGGLYLL